MLLKVIQGLVISEQWILDYIFVPHMHVYDIDPQVCLGLVLGGAVLWALFDPVMPQRTPQYRCEAMMHAHDAPGDRNTLSPGVNSVQKRCTVIVGHDANVVMDLMTEDVNPQDGEGGGVSFSLVWHRGTKRCVCCCCLLRFCNYAMSSSMQELRVIASWQCFDTVLVEWRTILLNLPTDPLFS